MTVAELIEQLNEHDGDALIVVSLNEEWCSPADEVSACTYVDQGDDVGDVSTCPGDAEIEGAVSAVYIRPLAEY